MPFTFKEAEKAFKNDKIGTLYPDPQGLRYLKLRSLSRAEHMLKLVENAKIKISTTSQKGMFEALYNSAVTDQQIDSVIRAIYKEERAVRVQNEDALVSELYKLQEFDWGGLHQNSLEKTIVDNYIKKIRSYDTLNDKIENELHNSMRGYVRCSWYNHWTSIIIEDVFRDHSLVLPAVGLVKKIDFFINDIPFDLKVTYLPEGYIKEKRKEAKQKPENTLLKKLCKELKIHFSEDMPEGHLLEDMWKKISDHPSDKAKDLIKSLKDFRLEIIKNCLADSEDLIKWLYENQGVRRFDASNRLFLVLVDKSNFFESWKLKRAKPLLISQIHKHLDSVNGKLGDDIEFDWDGEKYKTVSEIVYVVKE